MTVLGWSGSASAQGWLADRRFAEGPGIRTGDLELHPGIGAEGGYDSNWFLRSSNSGPNIVNGAPSLPPTDAAVIRVTPSFYISTLGIQRRTDAGPPQLTPRFINFRGGVSGTGRFFIGKGYTNQHNVSLNANARLGVNEGGHVAFGVFGSYARIIQPQVFADPNLAFNRNDIRLGGDLTFLPGGGTLDLRAGYALQASLYEESNGVPFSSITHEVSIRDRWKFRPRTALFSEAILGFVSYPDAPRAAFLLNNSTPLRSRLGVTGLVTNWFGTTVAGGYSATFFENPQLVTTRQFDSFNAQVEGTFYVGQGQGGTDQPGEATLLLSSIQVGFQRDFQRSLLGNFYGSNRVYTGLEYWFGGRVVVRLRAIGEQLNYPEVFFAGTVGPGSPASSVGEFTNYRLIGSLFAEYRFTQSFGLNTTIDYTRQFSDTLLPASTLPGTTTPGVFDMNYGRLQAFLGVRYFY
ncbi:MAG: hypothetical protein KIT84_35215 [Labilithrix sp.]|nr:hypothetical protein [Labilithrix sp.]